MEFLCKPINPFQDDGLSKEDRTMIDGMRNTAFVCGYKGGDVEYAVHKALKRMGRYDLLPPCEKESDKEYEVEVITRGNCMMCGKELTDGLFFCKECEESINERLGGKK